MNLSSLLNAHVHPKERGRPKHFFLLRVLAEAIYIKEMGAHYVTEEATLRSTFPKDSGESVQKRGFKDLNV